MKNLRIRRHKRIRARVFGTMETPRLCVFRSNKHIYGQIVDDTRGHIIVAVSDKGIKQKAGKVGVAHGVGKLLAEKAIKNKIKKLVFDRGGYKYHGRVKAFAEGAREGGLEF